jgi:N-succinyldiaminopimelate aminotransferase
VTAGSTEGICATLLGIIEPGDEVILVEPTYDSYPPLASMAQAAIRYVPLNLPDFSLPKEMLAKTFTSRTKAIVINTPQNPCGKVFTLEELRFVATLCEKHDAYAVGDEVYEHLVYDGREHVSLLAVPGLRHRAFSISSTAKTLSLTGWKQGFVVAAPELSRAVRMSHQFITFCGQSGLQEGVALGIDSSQSYYERFLKDYSRKRNLLCDGLRELGFEVFVPEGTYYALTDIRSIGFEDDVAFCRMLPAQAGVAAIPCSAFYFSKNPARHLVRFAFCKKDETLQEALRRLKKWKAHGTR